MKKKIFLVLFVLATIGLFIFAHQVLKDNEAKQQYKVQQNLKAPIEIPAEYVLSFVEAEKTNKPVVAMFYVDWCGYCRRYMPIFGKFAKEYKDKYTFAVINCDKPENRKLVEENNIMAFPTLIVFDKKNDYDFVLPQTVTIDKGIMKTSLNKYLKLREKIQNK